MPLYITRKLTGYIDEKHLLKDDREAEGQTQVNKQANSNYLYSIKASSSFFNRFQVANLICIKIGASPPSIPKLPWQLTS
jgi:hypothetical protein